MPCKRRWKRHMRPVLRERAPLLPPRLHRVGNAHLSLLPPPARPSASDTAVCPLQFLFKRLYRRPWNFGSRRRATLQDGGKGAFHSVTLRVCHTVFDLRIPVSHNRDHSQDDSACAHPTQSAKTAVREAPFTLTILEKRRTCAALGQITPTALNTESGRRSLRPTCRLGRVTNYSSPSPPPPPPPSPSPPSVPLPPPLLPDSKAASPTLTTCVTLTLGRQPRTSTSTRPETTSSENDSFAPNPFRDGRKDRERGSVLRTSITWS